MSRLLFPFRNGGSAVGCYNSVVAPVPFVVRVNSAAWIVVLNIGLFSGCMSTAPKVGLPSRSVFPDSQLHVLSDVKLKKDHPLLKELVELRDEIAATLNLPVPKSPVVVYLFGDEARYTNYMKVAFPSLPARRAYFVGTSRELAVYTYWGDRVREDLRHEYTHGVLHASLKDVPLWLDEGLAEFFEVSSKPTGLNREYAKQIQVLLGEGWKPDMERLEGLDNVAQMHKGDYQEAWGWVYYLLNDSAEGKRILVEYLHDLRETKNAGSLAQRVEASIPNYNFRYTAFAGSMGGMMQASIVRE